MAKRKAEVAGDETTAAPQPKAKKVKVMTTKKLSDKQKRLYEENGATPLLSMPPEIRNRIWELLLCDKDIHVSLQTEDHSDRQFIHHSVCSLKPDIGEVSTSKSGDASSDKAATPTRYDVAHYNCGLHRCGTMPSSSGLAPHHCPQSVKLPLALLQACRQVHSETALLPYQSNNFIFQGPVSLYAFAKTLLLGQVRAIKTITLALEFSGSNLLKSLVDLTRVRLHGLKKLTCLIEVCGLYPAFDYLPGKPSARQAMTDTVLQFKKTGLLPKVAVYNVTPNRSNYRPGTMPKETAVAWADELEAALRGSDIEET